jgi:response regulator RpfG family c-di-GMP phosphodiesterase
MPQPPIPIQVANVLLMDDNEVAGRAMRGIVGRSRHRCIVASSVDEAWQLLQELVIIDIVVVEPKLKQEDGIELISRIRSDPVFGGIPILVNTRIQDHAPAANLREYRIQNYAIQP